jgi:hypothetical protein
MDDKITCSKCGTKLRNDTYGSLCEDCWVNQRGVYQQAFSPAEQEAGCFNKPMRDAMLAEVDSKKV